MILTVGRFRVKDEPAARAAGERLYRELLPGRPGWLGAVVGRADDGSVVATGLWESEQERQASMDRPERQQWWQEFAASLEGDLEVAVYGNAELAMGALTAPIGFVQLIEARFREMPPALSDFQRVRPLLERHRPEISLMVLATDEDGQLVQLVGFTDEEAARAGEAKPRPDELAAMAEEVRSGFAGEPRFTDLRAPQVHLPG